MDSDRIMRAIRSGIFMKSRLVAVALALGLLAGCSDNLPVAPRTGGPDGQAVHLIGSYGIQGNDTSDGSADIVRLNSDGTGLTPVLPRAILYSAPHGGKMIYIAPGATLLFGELFVAGTDGSHPVSVAGYNLLEQIGFFSGVLSEDGTRIAYAIDRLDLIGGGDTTTLYIADADGGNRYALDTGISIESTPAFSPDGRSIAYYAGISGSTSGRLMVRSIDARLPAVTLVDGLEMASDGAMAPSWSRDGKRILFSLDATSLPVVAEVDTATKSVRNLTLGLFPEYSPDGTRIAYVGGSKGNPEIMLMNADGSDPVNLTNTEGNIELYPSWSPDGRSIVCTSYEGNPDSVAGRIEVIDVASRTMVRRLPEEGKTFGRMFWIP
jgi:Tol biopolymer transport system component